MTTYNEYRACTYLQGRILTISQVLNPSMQTGHISAKSPSKILSKSVGLIIFVGILSIAFFAALLKRLYKLYKEINQKLRK